MYNNRFSYYMYILLNYLIFLSLKKTFPAYDFGCRIRFSAPKLYFVYCEWVKNE